MSPVPNRIAARSLGLAAVTIILVIAGFSRIDPTGTQVHRLSFTERADGEGYVVRLHTDGAIQAHSREEISSSVSVITFYGAGLAPSVEKEDPPGPIRAYDLRSGENAVSLRLELDPATDLQMDVYPDGSSDDFLIALNAPGADSATASGSETERDSGASDRSTSTPDAEEADAQEGGSGQPYVLSKEERDRWKLDCVVIDPGHGGKDPGAHDNGVREKDIVLDIGLQLGHYIEKHLDLDVVYTRKSDRFVPLHERGRIANEKCGKLFISLHVNAIGGRNAHSVRGTETYILGLHKTDAAHRVMERENSVIKYEENPGRYEQYGEDGLVMQSLAQNMYMKESEQLADRVQDQFKHRVHRKSRGVKQAGFLVLWRASMPAILVELGFLSHPDEARFLTSEVGQAYLASAIFRAVRAYKKQYEKGLQLAAGDD